LKGCPPKYIVKLDEKSDRNKHLIFLYSDVLFRAGGIETYLHALATHLHQEKIPFRVAVAELERCPLLDELVARGIEIYRQRRVPGDRWLVRQRIMMAWLYFKLRPGDWVYCVRQPEPSLYLTLVRLVHRRKAKIAASWMFAPEFLPPENENFCRAVAETDAVISVAHCTASQFRKVYGYEGKVQVVPYHNLLFFKEPLASPPGPPWKIGYLGRLERKQKNLEQLLEAFARLAAKRSDVELHLHGHGPDQSVLEQLVIRENLQDRVVFHGPYDHRKDLPGIMARCHFFVYPSRFEGGPCFTLLEMMQAGRFCVASRVGGIPDLYEGHPEAGLLVASDDVAGLTKALETTVERITLGKVDGNRIRARYHEGGFDMTGAHRAWMKALALVE
jgi:glycosyltransferase involved in cell wall biosynthesis